MATALATLAAAYATEIAKISDSVVKAEATYLLERWQAAVAQTATLEAQNVISYSAADVSVQRRRIEESQSQANAMQARLRCMIYGDVVLVDQSYSSTGTDT
jgi:hypothetical protein